MLCKCSSWHNLACNQSSVDPGKVCMEIMLTDTSKVVGCNLQLTTSPSFFEKVLSRHSCKSIIYQRRKFSSLAFPSLTINLIIVWIAIDYTSHSLRLFTCYKEAILSSIKNKSSDAMLEQSFIILSSFAIDTKKGRKSFLDFCLMCWKMNLRKVF